MKILDHFLIQILRLLEDVHKQRGIEKRNLVLMIDGPQDNVLKLAEVLNLKTKVKR